MNDNNLFGQFCVPFCLLSYLLVQDADLQIIVWFAEEKEKQV